MHDRTNQPPTTNVIYVLNTPTTTTTHTPQATRLCLMAVHFFLGIEQRMADDEEEEEGAKRRSAHKMEVGNKRGGGGGMGWDWGEGWREGGWDGMGWDGTVYEGR